MGDIVKVRRKLEWLKLLGCTKARIKSLNRKPKLDKPPSIIRALEKQKNKEVAK